MHLTTSLHYLKRMSFQLGERSLIFCPARDGEEIVTMGESGCRNIEWNSFACSRFRNVDGQYLAPAWAQDLTTIFGYVWVRRDVEEQYKRLALDRMDDWLNSAARTQIDHRKEGERLG